MVAVSRCAVILAVIISVVALAAAATLPPKAKCPAHEEWSWCGQRCEPTCKVPVPTVETCPELECNPLKSACRCAEGFVRNEKRVCVLLEQCKN